MASANPYQAPGAAVADAGAEVQPVKVFSVSGRIGRLRYIAYTFGMAFLLGIIGNLVAILLGMVHPTLGGVGTIAVQVLIVIVLIMLTIQRSHDFDVTGWLAILAIIPLVNLIFWFIPGSDGPNRFGAPTPPNGVGVVIAACIVPLIVIIGVIAAVALPAYQDYQKRAVQMQKK